MKVCAPIAAVLIMLAVVVGCDGDDDSGKSSSSSSSTSSSSSSTSSSSSSSSGSAAAEKTVGGVAIPSSLKLCAQSLTAVSGSGSAGFSWNDVPDATRYAVRAVKSPPGATTTTELFNGIVEPGQFKNEYTFPERVAGTSYSIEVYALAGETALCQLDGVNGITG